MTRYDDKVEGGGLMVEERELRALFAPRRPDAGAFAAGIAERLAAATVTPQNDPEDAAAAQVRSTGVGTVPSRFGLRPVLDRAASVLGVPTFGDSGKSLLSILSLPFLLLVGIVVTFVHGFRRVDPAQHRDGPAPSARARKVHNTFQMLLPSIGSLLGIAAIAVYFLSGGSALVDLVTLVLMLGMVAMTWHIGQTARAGVASSVQTGRVIILMLLAAVFGCWAWLGSVVVFDGDSIFGHRAVGWVLWSGAAVACILTAWQSRNQDIGLSLILFFVLPLLGITALELPSNTASRVRSCLANSSLHPEQLSNWKEAATFAHALRAAGLPPVSLPHVHKRVADAVAASVALPPHPWTEEMREQVEVESQRVHPQVWSTAVRLNLLDQEQLRKLATVGFDAGRIEGLLNEEGTLRLVEYNFHLLACLLATRELTSAEREHLVRRIDQSGPQPGQPVNALEQALECARWLDRLGRRDVVLSRRAELHALLQQHWVVVADAAAFTRPGGFSYDPDTGQSSDIPSTATAVSLIEFVGAPPGLSLHHVSAYLRSQFRTSLMGEWITGKAVRLRQPEATLLQLRDGIGLPERSWLAVLVGERSLLAALLLVLLGLRAIRVAHRSERALLGAMP